MRELFIIAVIASSVFAMKPTAKGSMPAPEFEPLDHELGTECARLCTPEWKKASRSVPPLCVDYCRPRSLQIANRMQNR
jgi:hypothetical protein